MISLRYFRLLVTVLLAMAPAMFSNPGSAMAEGGYLARGKVFVMGERIPLGGATVYVMGRDDIETTTTSVTGDFELPLPEEGEYEISASMIGFAGGAPLKVIVSSEKPMVTGRLYLPPVERFSEIVVTAEKNLDQVGKRVVSGNEMKKMPGSMGDPLRGISNLPGLTTGSGFMAYPAIRGSDPDDNVFYVDNMQTNNLFHYGFVSVFHADLVEDFNLYLSSPGPEFKEALGGVIDITLRDPKTDRLHVTASVSFLEAELLLEGPLAEGHSLVVTGRRSYIDLLVGPFVKELDVGVKVIQFPWYYDYLAKYVWKISSRSKFSLFAHGTQDKMIMEMTDESAAAKQEPALVGDFDMDQLSNMQGMNLETAFSENVKNVITVFRRSTDQKVIVGQAISGDNDFTTSAAREILSIKASQNHALTLGAEKETSEINLFFEGKAWAPNEFEPDKDITSQDTKKLKTSFIGNGSAVFAKDRWRLAESVTLVLGARWMEDSYLKESYTMPRASMEVRPSKTLLLTAGWGEYVQFPPGQFVVDVFGNRNLKFEKSEHFTVGAKKKLYQGAWDAQVELYHKTFEDLIVPHAELNYANGGTGAAYGFEVLLRRNASAETSLHGWLAVTYSHSDRKNELTGEVFNYSRDQPLTINMLAAYRMGKWTVSGRWHFN
ncbi:MAG: TonB-dependent receptor, partial [Nitrospinota bacterium]|nr:TonB-dependent receptor [Nitrospinota bacterium]